MKLPDITIKQAEILRLLYTYRFLDRIQIQAFMNHKNKRRISSWLQDLRDKHYVEWIYSTDFAEKTKPAIYYLGSNGVRFLRSLESDDDTPAYPVDELRKRYREHQRSRTYIDRCLLVADCCLALRIADEQVDSQNDGKTSYEHITEPQYIDTTSKYRFLAEHDVLHPSLCIVKRRTKQGKVMTTNYLLEIFDGTLPRYRLRYRLKKYVTYLDDCEWEGDDPEPIILLVCSSITDLIYAKRSTKKLIEDTYEDDLHIRFTTTDLLRREGITAKIWEEGRLRFGL